MEPRQLLAADVAEIHVGAVYFEEASGDDSVGDVVSVTFEGGAPGTQLTRLVVDGDKLQDGEVTLGDVFADTQSQTENPNGLGTFGAVPLQVLSQSGFEVTSSQVADGSPLWVFEFSGFEAGEQFVFSLDVDEQGLFNSTALAEGGEFEGTRLTAEFTAPHFENATGGAIFFDQFDENFQSVENQTGSTLQLPPDNYIPPDQIDRSDRTAGAVTNLMQVPLPSAIEGRVFLDLDSNNLQDPQDSGIANITLQLWSLTGEQYIFTNQTTITDQFGDYRFENLQPGTYRVVESQPEGLISVGARAGNVLGQTRGNAESPDVITAIELVGGEQSVRNDFAETLPAKISGNVYHDRNDDGIQDAGEEGIEGVRIQVIPADVSDGSTATRETTTASDGSWFIDGLVPGTYRVVEIVQPVGFLDGRDTPGSKGGTAVNPGDEINGVLLAAADNAVEYNFGELKPGTISGRVHDDRDGDCNFDDGDVVLAGVAIELLDESGNVVRTTLTDSDGQYTFDGLAPGTYQVHEIQPQGFLDGSEHVGSAGGEVIGDDLIGEIVITSGVVGIRYDFCEHSPASISGQVFSDRNDNDQHDPGDIQLPGVLLELLDVQGNVISTTVTDSNGEYTFKDLLPGTYGVRETTPDGFFDSGEQVGSLGGDVADDLLTEITLLSGIDAKNYDFWEVEAASISGFVYVDANNNGIFDTGEETISGVLLELLDSNGNPTGRVTTTNNDGFYIFDSLQPGVYGVQETQPDDFIDGLDSAGTASGVAENPGDRITGAILAPATDGENYNFGERYSATLSGFVFQDGPTIVVVRGTEVNIADLRDGLLTPDDTPLAGVVITLADADGFVLIDQFGNPVQTQTDDTGYYEFRDLIPGTYTVIETQPAGFTDWLDTPGTTGGVAFNQGNPIDPSFANSDIANSHDAIALITLDARQHSRHNNFSEVVVEETFFFFPRKPILFQPPQQQPLLLQPRLLPLIPQPILVTPPPAPLFTGSSPVIGYTWHLSVVDAGKVRGSQLAEIAAARPNIFNVAKWATDEFQDAQWNWAQTRGDHRDIRIHGMRDVVPLAGDFNGDGLAEMVIYYKGEWFIDINGNGVWDEGDLWAKLGTADDLPVVGDWDGDGKMDIGIFGPAWAGDPVAISAEPGLPDPLNTNTARLKNIPPRLDEATQGDRVMRLTSQGRPRADLIDHVFAYGSPGDMPVAGDWDGDGIDTIAVFRDGGWTLDVDGNGKGSDLDHGFDFGEYGDKPVSGDFNGDGIDEIGIYRSGKWILDTNRNFKIDSEDQVINLGNADDLPLVADFNGDGIDEPAVYTTIPAQPPASQPDAK